MTADALRHSLLLAALFSFVIAAFVQARTNPRSTRMLWLVAGIVWSVLGVFDVRPVVWWSWLTAAWFVWLIALYALLTRIGQAALMRRNYSLARNILRICSWIEPGADARRQLWLISLLERTANQPLAERVASIEQSLAQATDSATRLVVLEQLAVALSQLREFDRLADTFDRAGGPAIVAQYPLLGFTMVRAYLEAERILPAAEAMARLSASAVGRSPGATLAMNATRIAFVAHLGQAELLEELFALPAQQLPSLAHQHRQLWRGLAAARRGEAERARELLEPLAQPRESDRRQNADAEQQEVAEVARRRLSCQLQLADPLAPPLIALCRQLVDSARSSRLFPQVKGLAWKLVPGTIVLLAIPAVMHLLVSWFGDSQDPWSLLRWGANSRQLVLAGDSYRLLSSANVHGGTIHLVLNLVALYMLGRLCEQIFGTWRYLTVYVVAAVGGSLFSVAFASQPLHLSVGASGAVFGLVGALLSAAIVLRGQVAESWRRRLTLNLLGIVVLQVLVGLRVPMIDNAAHGGGLLFGFVAGLLLRPSFESRSRVLHRLLGAVALAALVGSSIWAAAADERQLIAALPTKQVRHGHLSVRVPEYWQPRYDGARVAFDDALLATFRSPTLELRPLALGDATPVQMLRELAAGILVQLASYVDVSQPRLVGAIEEAGRVYRQRIEASVGAQRLVLVAFVKRQGDVVISGRTCLLAERQSTYRLVLRRALDSLHYAGSRGD